MANINTKEMTYEGIKNRGVANSLMVSYERGNAAPMDITEVFGSLENAIGYADSGTTSYAGQVIAVAGEDVETKVYKITSGGTLVELVDAIALNLKQDVIDDLDEIRSGAESGASALQEVPEEYAKKEWVSANYGNLTDVNSLKAKVTTLIGEDSGKTVRTIANEELAAQLIPSEAQESLDTLTEIAAWIQSHPEDASEMNKRIGDLEGEIPAVYTSANTYTDAQVAAHASAVSETLKAYATSGTVKTVSDNLASHAAANTTEFAAVRSEFASADAKTLKDAKAYADSKVTEHTQTVNTKFDELPMSSGDTKKSIILKDNGNTAVSEGAVSLGGSKKTAIFGHYALTGPINSDSGYSYSVSNSVFTDSIIAFFDDVISSNEQVYGNKNKFIGYDVENSTLTFEKPVEYSFDNQNYTAIYVENKHYPIGYIYDADEITGSESIKEGSFAINRSMAGGLLSNSSNEARAYAPLSTAEGTGGYSSKIGRHFQGEQLVPGSDDENGYAGSYGIGSHVEGNLTVTTMAASYGHAEGHSTTTTAFAGHSEGRQTIAGNIAAHAEGNSPMALGPAAHAEGKGDNEYGAVYYKSIEKITDLADIWFSGNTNGKYKKGFSAALSEASHTEGLNNISVGVASHVEGTLNATMSDFSHSEGINNISSGVASHTGGSGNTTNADCAFSIGIKNVSNAVASVTMGYKNTSNGVYSFAGGKNSKAEMLDGFAWGDSVISSGRHATVFGQGTLANNDNEFACGKYNVSNADTLFSVGNGTKESLSNAFEVTTDGNAKIKGSIYEGGEKLEEKYSSIDHTHEEFTLLSGLSDTVAELESTVENLDSTVDAHEVRLDEIENDCLVLTESKSLQLLDSSFNLGLNVCLTNFTTPVYLGKKTDGTYFRPSDYASNPTLITETHAASWQSSISYKGLCNEIYVKPYNFKTVATTTYLLVKVTRASCTLPSTGNTTGTNKDFGILKSQRAVDGSSIAKYYNFAIYSGDTLAIPLTSDYIIPDNFLSNNGIGDVWDSELFDITSIAYNPSTGFTQVNMAPFSGTPQGEYSQKIVGMMDDTNLPNNKNVIIDNISSPHDLRLPSSPRIGKKYEIIHTNKSATLKSGEVHIVRDNGFTNAQSLSGSTVSSVIYDGKRWFFYTNLLSNLF